MRNIIRNTKFYTKLVIGFILIFLANLFTINIGYCEDNFFIGTNFEQAKTKPKISSDKVAKSLGQQKKEKFSLLNFFKKFDEDVDPKGYWGTLPNIEEDFKYKKPTSSAPKIEIENPNEENLKDENLKSAPFDDALFLDMVIKKEPNSQYVNDIQKIKFALNKLKNCLENKGDIQLYNGCVNVLELYVKNFKQKYENEPESSKESYIEVLNTNYYAKVLGNLKYDANYYSRYIPTTEGQYSKANIEAKEELLLDRVNKTIFLLNNES